MSSQKEIPIGFLPATENCFRQWRQFRIVHVHSFCSAESCKALGARDLRSTQLPGILLIEPQIRCNSNILRKPKCCICAYSSLTIQVHIIRLTGTQHIRQCVRRDVERLNLFSENFTGTYRHHSVSHTQFISSLENIHDLHFTRTVLGPTKTDSLSCLIRMLIFPEKEPRNASALTKTRRRRIA